MDKVNRSTIKTCKKFVPNVRTSKNIFTSDKISKKISEQSCTILKAVPKNSDTDV
jgi:hypothetical protein